MGGRKDKVQSEAKSPEWDPDTNILPASEYDQVPIHSWEPPALWEGFEIDEREGVELSMFDIYTSRWSIYSFDHAEVSKLQDSKKMKRLSNII